MDSCKKCSLCGKKGDTFGCDRLCKRCELGRQQYEKIAKSGTKEQKKALGIN